MALHRLDATAGTVVDVFSRDALPALTVDPGDTVVLRSLDASGYVEQQRSPGEQVPRLLADARGHCLTGPIEVRGAEPGMTVSVHLRRMQPDGWGWTVAAAADNPLNRRLGVTGGPPSWLLWEIGESRATNQHGLSVPVAPFLGVIGVAPAASGDHSTIPPRAESGGNVDCRALTAGSTLFLPVNVPGALLSLGDGHAAQGDGEVGGTAVECAMTTELVVNLVAEPALRAVHATTPTSRITFGFSDDLNAATGDALDAMITWLQALHGLDRPTALAVASGCVDLHVTQVANSVWGVHAMLSSERLLG